MPTSTAAGAEAVAKACGGHALAVDLIANAEQAVEDGARLLGGLDVLVNNAGFGAGEAFLDMKAETWDRTLGLNVKALALASAAAGRIMMRAEVRPHHQHHLAGLAHGAAELHRLCGLEGRASTRSRAPPRSRSRRTASGSTRSRPA